MIPIRIQRRRTKGFDMQAVSRAANGLECVYVGRPTIYGNPWTLRAFMEVYSCSYTRDDGRQTCKDYFAAWMGGHPEEPTEASRPNLSELRGKNLSCFCRLDQPCHADVLLDLANR